MENQEFLEIGKKYGTPCYVFDVPKLVRRLEEMKKILGEQMELCYSIKANPFLIPVLPECVGKLEVCSPGELEICRNQEVNPEKIIYSGVNKGPEDVHAALTYGVGTATAESLRHVELLNQEAVKQGRKVPVLLRLNAGSQFGMSKEDLLYVIENRNQYAGIHIAGIHYFTGTQRKNIRSQQKDLDRLVDIYREIKEAYGFTLERLEYGPGLPVPYFEQEDFSDTLAPLKKLAPLLTDAYDRMQEALGSKVSFTVEMGRFCAAACGYYLTKVADQKSNERMNYCILDGGIHQVNYLGQMMGMKIPQILHLKEKQAAAEERKEWCLCGSLCTTSDVLVRQIEMDNLEMGDILVFCNVGAYSVTEGMLMFLSRNMPGIVLYRGEGQTELIRGQIATSQFHY